jgi:hypothetical protein
MVHVYISSLTVRLQAVKEDGTRGWVPSWLIGKASTGPIPPTPVSLSQSTLHGNDPRYDGDEVNGSSSTLKGLSTSQINGIVPNNGSSTSNLNSQPSPLSTAFALKS